jgi:hypothetical protein
MSLDGRGRKRVATPLPPHEKIRRCGRNAKTVPKAEQRQELRKIRVAHQVVIAFTSSAPPLIERPHNQALTTSTVARGEDQVVQ